MRVRVFGQYVHWFALALAALDGLLFYLAVPAAAVLRFGQPLAAIEQEFGSLMPPALVFSGALLVGQFAFGLYGTQQHSRALDHVLCQCGAIAVGAVLSVIVFYAIPPLALGRGVLGSALLLSALSAIATRALFQHIIDRDLFKRRVIVYGCGTRAQLIAAMHERSDCCGFLLLGFVCTRNEACCVPERRLLHPQGSLLALCRQLHVSEIVIAMEDRRSGLPVWDLAECRLAGVEVTELPGFLERETGCVRLDAVTPGWLAFSPGFSRGALRLLSSRALDLVIGSLLLCLSLPVMLLVALAIKLEDGWNAPVLYSQMRVGLLGQSFRLLKFRSMRPDAERDGRAHWAAVRDPRVTRVGAWLRRFRIDELPQVINVLRGDMSFVGPRPERPEIVADLLKQMPYYAHRHFVRPGLTGWAQLCYPYGASEHDAQEKLQYDLYYIKHNNLLLDLSIVLQTAEAVLLGKGVR